MVTTFGRTAAADARKKSRIESSIRIKGGKLIQNLGGTVPTKKMLKLFFVDISKNFSLLKDDISPAEGTRSVEEQ